MQYSVHGAVHGSKYLGVFDADSVEEALRLAESQAGAQFCHRCSSECEDPEVEVVALTLDGVVVWDRKAAAETAAEDAEEVRRRREADREDAVEHLAEAMRLLFQLRVELNGDDATGDAVELRRRIREASGYVEGLR